MRKLVLLAALVLLGSQGWAASTQDIASLTEDGTGARTDLMEIQDVSDTSGDPDGTSKKVQIGTILGLIEAGDIPDISATYLGVSADAAGVAANSVALTTDTTGNYVSSATANGGLALTGTEGGSLGMITTCSDNQVLAYTAAGGWACANDATGGTPAEDSITTTMLDDAADTPSAGQLVVVGSTTTQVEYIDSVTLQWATSIEYEGATADAYETLLSVTDPTADRTITLPDATGTVALTASPTFTGTVNMAAMVATGTINGLVEVTVDTAATASPTCDGEWRINGDNDVIDYTLPGAAAGLVCCFYSQYAAVVTVDTADGVDTITLDGTALTAGNAIDSPGTAGDFSCVMAIDATNWLVLGKSGTWVDGGAD